MTSPTLLITDRLPFLWRLLGVNYTQLRAILAVKLQLDNRRPAGLNQWKKEGESKNAFWISLAIYSLFGAFLAFYLAIAEPMGIVMPATLFFGYILIVCTMSLISDFSSVILDSSDNQIMLFRPVDSRTVFMARVVHIISYLATIALAVGAFGILVIGYRFGAVAGLLSLVLCLLMAVLAVFLTNVIYLSLMQLISEERLREVINYVQIVMAIFFYGGYQLLPRLVDGDSLTGTQPFVWKAWHYVVPPLWSAGSLDMIVNRQTDVRHLVLLGLALTVPFVGLYLMNRVLAPVFSRKLAGLDQAEKAERPVPAAAADAALVAPVSLANRVANWLTTSSLERAGFLFVWLSTGRDRKFKLRTYPGLGFGLAYAVIMTLNSSKPGAGHNGGFYLFILYFGSIYLLTALMQLSVSDNYKAAWIYESAPMQQPGQILGGGLKALVVKLMIPYFCLLAAYVLYLKGPVILPDVLLAFVNSLVMLLITAVMGKRHLPFSVAQDVIKNSSTARTFVSMFIAGMVGVAHWGLTYVPYGQWLMLPVMLVVVVLLYRSYSRTTWGEIEG